MKLFISSLLLSVISTSAYSTSPDAWGEFAQRIDTECRSLVSGGERQLNNLNVIVDQYNGVVLLVGVNRRGYETLTLCVYDKKDSNAWLADSILLEDLRPDFNN